MRIALILALALLAAFVAEPYVARYFYASEAPRTVAARGDLAPAEQATTELFQRASPSVVHVFAQPGGGGGKLDRPGRGRRGRADRHRLRLGRGRAISSPTTTSSRALRGRSPSRLATGETVLGHPGRRRAELRSRRAAPRTREQAAGRLSPSARRRT